VQRRIKVAVLMGGKTPEHEISLISGREVVRNIDTKKYEVLPVVISRNGKSWRLTSPQKLLSLPDPSTIKDLKTELVRAGYKDVQGIDQMSKVGADVVFIAMHGPYGEDGTVQGMLDLAGVKYTGSGVAASAIGMDKLLFRKLLKSEGIPIPKFVAVEKNKDYEKIFKVLGNFPYFVKPHNQGSSVGASIVKNQEDLEKALNLAFKYSNITLVDEYILGKEITCGILGNEASIALPLVEIIPKNEFFDYDSKYTESGTQEIIPARVPKSLTKEIQRIALKVYKILGCKGFARVDFILRNNKFPVVLEINTIPGLTPMSLLPKAAKKAGFSYSELLDKIVNYAIE